MSLTAKRDLASRRGGPKKNNASEATEIWTVRGATSADTQYTICACTDLPDIGEADSNGAVCTSKDAQETENVTAWKVTVKYERTPPNSDQPDSGSNPADQNQPDPLQRSTDYQYSCVRYPYVPTTDKKGKAILNSADDKFDPPPTIDRINLRIVVSRNENSFPLLVFGGFAGLFHASKLVDKVNRDTVTIDGSAYDPGRLRITDISAQKIWENATVYYRVTYSLEDKPDKWNPIKIPNEGPNMLIEDPEDPGGFIKVSARDDTGLATGGNVALNSITSPGGSTAGTKKPVDADGFVMADDLDFYLYDDENINGLAL